jgi:hypothetical protein
MIQGVDGQECLPLTDEDEDDSTHKSLGDDGG